jgi:hypothetical protein
MSLTDIQKQLYKKDESENTAGKNKNNNLSFQEIKTTAPKPAAEDLWVEKNKTLGITEKRVVRWGIIALGFILLVISVFVVIYFVKKTSFNENGLKISISGPDQSISGKLLTYEINYHNYNRADLRNAVLRVSYSENFRPENNPNFKEENSSNGSFELGTIAGKSGGKTVLSGRAYSPKGALIYVKFDLVYQPAGFDQNFEKKDQVGINISAAPINLEIQAPQSVSSGDEANYLITYKNNGTEAFENFKIKIDYPEKFSFSSSDPATFEGNNVWYIGRLEPGQDGKIIANGKLEGERNQLKKVKVYLGTGDQNEFSIYNEGEAVTEIIASPLVISQTVNGEKELKADSGDVLNFKIFYKNTGNVGLKDVIISEKIDSPVLNYASLKTSGGSFDQDKKTIIWKASDTKVLKNLEPGSGGEIFFSIQIKDRIEIKNNSDKNFVISSVAKIDSPDIPTPVSSNKIISGNKIDIKLNSKIIFSVNGYHTDPNIPNSGPIPPKVGEETTYVMHWSAVNVSNDLADAKVEAIISTGVVMTGKIFPDDANIIYNERSNSIVWNIGNMSAGTGILSSPKEASFQLKIKPAPNQAGKEVVLLRESKFTAKDLFTGENLEKTAVEKNTYLPEDNSVGNDSKVVN